MSIDVGLSHTPTRSPLIFWYYYLVLIEKCHLRFSQRINWWGRGYVAVFPSTHSRRVIRVARLKMLCFKNNQITDIKIQSLISSAKVFFLLLNLVLMQQKSCIKLKHHCVQPAYKPHASNDVFTIKIFLVSYIISLALL